MSYYNFRLNDPSTFSTSSPDSKSQNKFVHKTFEDYSKAKTSAAAGQDGAALSKTVMNQDLRGKFSVQGYSEPTSTNSTNTLGPGIAVDDYVIPEEIHAVSINASLQTITHTYSPVLLGYLSSLGNRTSIRLVKLAGQSSWHAHDHTDEVFILLRGAITIAYKSGSGMEKSVRLIGGELLVVPMRMEHCVIAEEGTEVLLLEGCLENEM
jgi:mannose-6-phosphate isomerase-like protein (cupin superfamily)